MTILFKLVSIEATPRDFLRHYEIVYNKNLDFYLAMNLLALDKIDISYLQRLDLEGCLKNIGICNLYP